MYEDPSSLEELASFLAQNARVMYEWACDVPKSLKIPGKGSAESLSTERNPLNFDQFSPIWLQLQRILLEINSISSSSVVKFSDLFAVYTWILINYASL